MSHSPGTSRRQLLRTCAGGVLAGRTLSGQGRTPSSRVVIARDRALRGGGATPDSSRLLKLLDRAVQSCFDTGSAAEAWHKVARPGEVVGLKVNCLAGKGISTHVVLTQAICERLQQAGIPRKDILIWDRLNDDLDSAGFRVSVDRNGIRCVGNDEWGYEEELLVHGSAGSLVCNSLARVCHAVINLPVLKDHSIVGVTLALKNFFGAIHNPNKYHMNAGDPYVADVYMLPPIRDKVRVTICDALSAAYEGGPSYMPQWTWPFNGLMVSRDPVALDYTGWQIIEKKRAEMGMKPLKAEGREPKYIATAADARHRLGTCDPARIEQIEV